jgi:zinc protease
MKKIFCLLIVCFLFFQNASASYLDNIRKCEFTSRDCHIYERNGSGIVDMIVILRHNGTAYEEKNGINAMALAMINMGSKNDTYRDFQNKLKDLSTTFNVYSSQDHSYIHIRSLKENFSQSIDLAFGAFFDPNFSEENFQLVKNAMISSIRESQQDYPFLANHAFLKEIFKGQIYEPQDLKEDDVNALTIDDVQKYIYHKLRNALNEVVISGDVDEENFGKKLEGYLMYFGKDDFSSKKISEPMKLNLFSKPVFVKDDVQKAQTIIHFAQKMPESSDKDLMAMYLINDYIGGGGLNSKLMKKLREEMNITYSARTNVMIAEKMNYMSGSIATGSKDVEQILNEINGIFKNVSDNGITDDELNDLKTKFYGKQAMRFSDNGSALRNLLFLIDNKLPFDFYEKNIDFVQKINAKDIKNAAKKFIDNKNLSFVIFN